MRSEQETSMFNIRKITQYINEITDHLKKIDDENSELASLIEYLKDFSIFLTQLSSKYDFQTEKSDIIEEKNLISEKLLIIPQFKVLINYLLSLTNKNIEKFDYNNKILFDNIFNNYFNNRNENIINDFLNKFQINKLNIIENNKFNIIRENNQNLISKLNDLIFILPLENNNFQFSSSFLHFLEKKNENNKLNFEQYYKELKISHQEIISILFNKRIQKYKFDEFINFLPFNIIEKSNEYLQLINNTEKMIRNLEKTFIETIKQPSKIYFELLKNYNLLKEISQLPNFTNQINELNNEKLKLICKLKQLQIIFIITQKFHEKPLKSFSIYEFLNFESELLNKIKIFIDNNNNNDLINIIMISIEKYDEFFSKLLKEKNQLKNLSNKFNIEMSKITPNLNIKRNIENQFKINLNLIPKYEDFENNINKHNEICDQLTKLKLFNSNFNDPLKFVNNEYSENKYLELKLENKIKKIEEIKKIIKKKQKKILKIKIINENINKNINKNNLNKKIEEKPKNIYELKNKCLCPICATNFRNVAINICGHTLCKECLEIQLKARNRKCPACNTKFSNSQVVEIKWN